MLSPGVNTTTIEKVKYTPNINNEIGCFAGHFEKGPINVPTFITDINEFKFIFGRGINYHHNDWYQIYNFLQYSNGVWVTRTAGDTYYNSSNIINYDFSINNKLDYENTQLYYNNNVNIIAKTPGEWGNILSIATVHNEDFDNNVTVYDTKKIKNIFSFFEENNTGIIVFRNNKIVEIFYVPDTEIIINSSYIYFSTDSNNIPSFYDNMIIKLGNGYTGVPTGRNIEESYNLFTKEDYEIDIIIGNDKSNIAAINLANSRKDCIAFIGLPKSFHKILIGMGLPLSNEMNKIFQLSNKVSPSERLTDDYKTGLFDYLKSLPYSEYVHFTFGIKEQFDGFSNTYKLVNLAGDTAGLKAAASKDRPWGIGAGLEKGVILNTEKIIPRIGKIDKLKMYQHGFNIIDNNILMTQKTYTVTPSKFNRINIRSLFNHIERYVENYVKSYVFDESTPSNRKQIALGIKKILLEAKSNKGIISGKVHCYNDNGNIKVDVFINPTSINETVNLQMINTGNNTISNIIG